MDIYELAEMLVAYNKISSKRYSEILIKFEKKSDDLRRKTYC
jgi:hypothetical protein